MAHSGAPQVTRLKARENMRLAVSLRAVEGRFSPARGGAERPPLVESTVSRPAGVEHDADGLPWDWRTPSREGVFQS
jgi:hypothetical protein